MSKERLMRAVVCAALAAFAAVTLAGRVARVSSAARQTQTDKPVEQTRKNIQVLKGLPSSQLFPLMNFVSVSLGVRCDFCHVKQAKTRRRVSTTGSGRATTSRRRRPRDR